MSPLIPQPLTVADRVLERARNRRRPLMPDDELAIRFFCDDLCESLRAKGEYPEDETFLVHWLVSTVGGVELRAEPGKPASLTMVAPDAGMYDDPAELGDDVAPYGGVVKIDLPAARRDA